MAHTALEIRMMEQSINKLNDDDPDERRYGAWDLVLTGDERAVEPLLDAIEAGRDEWGAAREALCVILIRSYAQLDPNGVSQALCSAIRDEGGTAVHVSLLQHILNAAGPRLGMQDLQGRIVRALYDTDTLIRIVLLIEIIGDAEDPNAVECLCEILEWHHSSDARALAAEYLGGIQCERALETLCNALDDGNNHVRTYVAAALGRFQCPRSVKALLVALKDEDAFVVIAASESLASFKDTRIVPALCATLERDDEGIRKCVADKLGDLCDTRSVDPLCTCLATEKSSQVREAVSYALGKLKDPRAVSPVCGVLADEDPAVRAAAATALMWINDFSAHDSLLPLRSDPHGLPRWRAAQALCWLTKGDRMAPLLGALADRNHEVRRFAAIELGRLGDGRAVQPLKAALKDENWRVRIAAAESLYYWQLEPVRRTPNLGHAVYGILGRFPGPTEAWEAVLSRDFEALIRLDEAAAEPLIVALNHGWDASDVRLLWQRYGFERLARVTRATVIDADRDTLGQRRLWRSESRVSVEEEEPIAFVQLDSKSGQHIVRVPPNSQTCSQAVAWMAGFDDPDQYRPLVET